MKIAFDGMVFYKQQYGGVSRYVVELANGINQGSHQARIFAPIHKNEALASMPVRKEYRTNWKSPLQKHRNLIRLLNRRIASRQIDNWKPDLLHQSTYWECVDLKRPLPIVVTVHDMIQELFPDHFRKRSDHTEAKRLAVEKADHVICISDSTKQDLLRLFGVRESKVSVVHSGVSAFPALKAPVNLPKNYLLYVGKRGGYKNFNGFLTAFANSARLRSDFSIVAFGGRAFDNQERLLISSLGLEEGQVIQIGGDDTVLGACYRNATAFVHPSLYEGFGFPPLEAMINDCPVISSNTSAMPEVIMDAGQLFDPTDSHSMVSAIESVVYDRALRNRLIANGRKRSEAMSWLKCANETLKVYEKLL